MLFSMHALEIDRTELREASDADIEFENYEGPVEQIDSREAIRGIGRYLGDGTAADGEADYAGRYRAYRIIGDATEPLRAADVIELSASARVDHIVNLRRIVAGYLETAWGYNREDADLLSRFTTIYNAVHRGNLDFFAQRYRSAVVARLDSDRVGLATSYRRWAGQTQIVIPIRPERAAGDLDAVDPGQLVDEAVIAELRTRSDLGIEDRKAIIAFIERVIEERTEVIAEERAAIEEEQAEIDERQAEIEEEIAAIEEDEPEEETPPAAPAEDSAQPSPVDDEPDSTVDEAADEAEPTEEEPPAERPDEEEPAAAPATDEDVPVDDGDDAPADAPEEQVETPPSDEDDQRAALESEQEALAEREDELEERRQELDEEEEDVESLTEEVEELYQETAEDQEAVEAGGEPTELVPFAIANESGVFELAIIDLDDLTISGEQTVPVMTREPVSYQGGLLVAHAGSSKLLLLDATSLAIIAESDADVVPDGRIRVVGTSVLAVINEAGTYYVGEFDAQLVLQRRSAESVRSDTDIVNRGDRLLVQGADGSLRTLSLEAFQ